MGVDMNAQIAELRRGVEVLVATPGRLLDHVQNKTVMFNQVSVLVLDEADRMLGHGFMPDIKRIIALLPASGRTCSSRRPCPDEIRNLAARRCCTTRQNSVAARKRCRESVTHVLHRWRAKRSASCSPTSSRRAA